MKLSEFRKRSHEYTSKASEITRQLVLAGIAIIWLFKEKDTNALDSFAILPLIVLGFALLFDLVQYIVGGQLWISFFREKEREAKPGEDPDIKAPAKLSKVLYNLYWTKIGLTGIAYVLIIIFLIKHLNFK